MTDYRQASSCHTEAEVTRWIPESPTHPGVYAVAARIRPRRARVHVDAGGSPSAATLPLRCVDPDSEEVDGLVVARACGGPGILGSRHGALDPPDAACGGPRILVGRRPVRHPSSYGRNLTPAFLASQWTVASGATPSSCASVRYSPGSPLRLATCSRTYFTLSLCRALRAVSSGSGAFDRYPSSSAISRMVLGEYPVSPASGSASGRSGQASRTRSLTCSGVIGWRRSPRLWAVFVACRTVRPNSAETARAPPSR